MLSSLLLALLPCHVYELLLVSHDIVEVELMDLAKLDIFVPGGETARHESGPAAGQEHAHGCGDCFRAVFAVWTRDTKGQA